MTGKCALPSEFCGHDECCICCPENESCNTQCGEKDGHEYAESCLITGYQKLKRRMKHDRTNDDYRKYEK